MTDNIITAKFLDEMLKLLHKKIDTLIENTESQQKDNFWSTMLQSINHQKEFIENYNEYLEHNKKYILQKLKIESNSVAEEEGENGIDLDLEGKTQLNQHSDEEYYVNIDDIDFDSLDDED